MLKLVIVGFIFATVSAAPLESTPSGNSSNDKPHIQTLLLRPSPINPDIPVDPKPAERIILDDTKPERDQRSLSDKDKLPAHGHESHEHGSHEHGSHENDSHENESHEHDSHGHDSNEHGSHEDPKIVPQKRNEHSDYKHDEHSHEEHHNEKSNDHEKDGYKQPIHYDHQDHKRESDDFIVPAKSDLKSKELASNHSIQPITSGEPTILYAKKEDEKRSVTDSFETSHHIPHIDESERTFETSHHIPSHIEDERTKSVENAKVGQKSLTQ